jgi:hypothetical protein
MIRVSAFATPAYLFHKASFVGDTIGAEAAIKKTRDLIGTI